MKSIQSSLIVIALISCGRQERPTAKPPKILSSQPSQEEVYPELSLTDNGASVGGNYAPNEFEGRVNNGKYLEKTYSFSLPQASFVKVSNYKTKEKCRIKGKTIPQFFVYGRPSLTETKMTFGEVKKLAAGKYLLKVKNKNQFACAQMGVNFSVTILPAK